MALESMKPKMLSYIDRLLEKVTMYRLLIYYLGGLLVAAFGLSLFGDLKYKPLYILISTVILVLGCYLINKIFAQFFTAPVNPESSIITGLILSLIITPDPTGFGITFLLAAAGLAIASKYILSVRMKHIFNPAAIAVVLTAQGPHQSASWWVGTAVLLPFVLIGGLLVVRKIHRTKMVLGFFISSFLATILYSLIGKTGVMTGLHNLIFSSAMFFLGFVMLTEPLTSPTTTKKQAWYGILVGILLPPQAHLFSYYFSPESALIVGNLFAYIISPKTKLFPTILQKIRIAASSAEFVFNPNQKLAYQPGQFMEWTLPHSDTDSRGSRRYFTIASSPTEEDIRIGIKFFDKGSSFKDALLDIDQNSQIVASQISGNFIMPKDKSKKLVFIAGGIGITPYRSMIKYLIDKNQKRDVILLYSVTNDKEISYKKIFEQARESLGIKTIYTVTDDDAVASESNTRKGFINAEFIKREVPDYQDRIFYISGTQGMVSALYKALISLGVSRKQIKTDYFPGYTPKK